jgi:hypothetical protein
MRFLRWRKMTWVFLVVNALFVLWITTGVADRASGDCPPGDELCISASDAGTAIGVGLIVFLWFLVFMALSATWFMTRPKGRTCPACGENVKRGRTTCQKCSHDFAAAAATPAVTT